MYASGNRGYYGRNNNNYSNARYMGSNRGRNNGGEKKRSGAKMANVKEGKAISGWRVSRFGMVTYFASFNGKFTKRKVGSNGKPYITGVAVKILNKDTSQESWTWGIWSEHGQTLTCDKIGIYITLKNGGFVGRIKR